MLEVLTPATKMDLVQLATVKAHLRPAIVGTGEDARLADLIRWASAAINRYCRRTFARQKYIQTLPGSGQTLMLGPAPIEEVVAVGMRGSPVTDYRVENAAAGFLWRLNGWPGSYGTAGIYNRRMDRGLQDLNVVEVEFWAGYQMPGETPIAGAYLLPDDVERAALLTVQEWFRGDARDPGLVSTSTTESEGEVSRTVSSSFTPARTLGQVGALPPEARDLLRGYRR